MARMAFNIPDGGMTSRSRGNLTARTGSPLSSRRNINTGMLSARHHPKTPKTPLSYRERSVNSNNLASPRNMVLQKKVSTKAFSALRVEESVPGTPESGDSPVTALSVDIPKLSLGDVGKKQNAAAESRKQTRKSTDSKFYDFEKVKKKLEDDGIDIDRLKYAFGEADENDEDEDKGLDIDEFHKLWKIVFPQRDMDENSWKYIDRIFFEIDNDESGKISWEEILTYLDKSRTVVERGKAPTHWKEIAFRFVGYNEEVYDDSDSTQAKFVALYKFFSQCVVVLSIVVLMIESLPSMQKEDANDSPGNEVTFGLEAFCVVIFSIEFLVWIIAYPYSEQWTDTNGDTYVLARDEEIWPRPDTLERVKWSLFFKEQNTYIDFLSVVPFYITLVVEGRDSISALQSVRLLRLLRLLRITRILKLGRSGSYGRAPELGAALQKSVTSLLFLVMLITICTTIAAAFMFYSELDQAHFNPTAQKWYRNTDSDYVDAGQLLQMQSIPEALWWGIVTLTTVGYGDLYPITIAGKIVASITMLGGLIVVGYPITILTGTFQMMEMERFMKEEQLDRCREFYQGIKEWLQAADEDVICESVKDGERTKRSSVMTQQPPNNSNQDVREVLNALENRIASRLSSIMQRVDALERDTDDEDVDEDSIDSDSTSTRSDSTSTVSQPGQPTTPLSASRAPEFIPSLAIN